MIISITRSQTIFFSIIFFVTFDNINRFIVKDVFFLSFDISMKMALSLNYLAFIVCDIILEISSIKDCRPIHL